ncbi:hypothetical protein GOP47_0008789 [Adiantum capillus-veneris]|uniref:CBS domain-containing protein n=1 Tax=Adiantum capillus-veneris TaxID=13818 RepID=A0A9D4UZB2_ADICA|nr:hypothetical protein GOP47_0008789 [Adiantum capillus-veneris]
MVDLEPSGSLHDPEKSQVNIRPDMCGIECNSSCLKDKWTVGMARWSNSSSAPSETTEEMASDISRTISGTHRQLSEKKGIVVENLRKVQQEGQHDEDGPSGGNNQQESLAGEQAPKGPPPSQPLKVFFDRVPLSSIPGLKNGQVLELRMKECIGEAIRRLYLDSVMGAPVCDETGTEHGLGIIGTDPYVGLVELSSMLLWVLEELEKADIEGRKRGLRGINTDTKFHNEEERVLEEKGFFRSLREHTSIWDTKVAAMARSFMWGPFLPVRPEDTLLHALLMLSKHTLKAVPVMDSTTKRVTGFITQDAAIQLLLQCAGLEWFDSIADKRLSSFKFEVEDASRDIVHIDCKKPVLEAMMCMWKQRVSGMPIIDSETKKIVGNIRTTDVRLLLDNAEVFEERRSMSLEELMKVDMELYEMGLQDEDEEEMSAIISAAALHLKRGWRPRMSEVVTCTSEDTLKQLMAKLTAARADRGFLVDQDMHVVGLVTLRDIIIQFAPPLTQCSQLTPGFFHT